MHVAYRLRVSELVISMYRALVEQGDPISDVLLEKRSIKIVFTVYVFMAIILSSAYKNDNVLHMIQARVPLLYKTYEHLVKDNFTLYTRAIIVEEMFISVFMIEVLQRNPIINTPHHIGYFVSPNRRFFEDARIVSEILRDLRINHKKQRYDIGRLLFNTSTMLPDTVRLLRELHNYSRDQYLNKRFTVHEARQLLLDMQQRIFIDKLKQCKRVAVLVPYHKAIEYLELLRNETHKFIATSIGDIRYENYRIAFYLAGKTPFNVFQRLDRIKTSGIWNWTGGFVTDMINQRVLVNSYIKNTVTAASLKGNILVIFTVFLVGLGISLLIFALEVVRINIFIRALLRKIRKQLKFMIKCGPRKNKQHIKKGLVNVLQRIMASGRKFCRRLRKCKISAIPVALDRNKH